MRSSASANDEHNFPNAPLREAAMLRRRMLRLEQQIVRLEHKTTVSKT